MLATAFPTVIRAEDPPAQTKPLDATQGKTKDLPGAPGPSAASQVAPTGNMGISSGQAINTPSKSQGISDQAKDQSASGQAAQSIQTAQLPSQAEASSTKGSNAGSQPSSGTAGSRTSQDTEANPLAGKQVQSTGQVNSPPKKDGDGDGLGKPGLTSGQDKDTLSKASGVKVADDVQSSGHFMMYFVTAAVLVVLLYIVYHKRNLIFALLLEGRRSGSGRRRNVSSGSGTEYRQLSTAEEALPDDGSKSDIKGKSYMY